MVTLIVTVGGLLVAKPFDNNPNIADPISSLEPAFHNNNWKVLVLGKASAILVCIETISTDCVYRGDDIDCLACEPVHRKLHNSQIDSR